LHPQSSFFLLYSASIDLQEAEDSIDEEDPRPTSSTWSYIINILHVYLHEFSEVRVEGLDTLDYLDN